MVFTTFNLKKNTNKIGMMCVAVQLALASTTYAQEPGDLTDLSLEDLMNVEVTSVNRHAESLFDSAAAVYVISNQDIVRSGATSVPEALRMVPGLNVAQIDGAKWMVGSRAFGSRFSNNLQVMVDGRSIYTPAFNGVYWEQLDIVMADIDRIEVIRGPGSTLWGANAVNGVINIITKVANDTQGGYAMGRIGDEQNGATLRYGAQLGEGAYGRAYVKYKKNNTQALATGGDSYDGQRNEQGGFRFDKSLGESGKLTLQGDVYKVRTQQVETIPTLLPPYTSNQSNVRDSDGWNLLGRWEKPLSVTSDMSLQMYVDYYSVDELALAPHDNTTIDIDFQHHKTFNNSHDLIWGLGYYNTKTDITSTSTTTSIKNSENRERYSAFIQDEITLLKDELALTIGSKFEHNTITGFEYQPNARMIWKPTKNQSIWGSATRSVRIPSVAEELIQLNFANLPPSQAIPAPVSLVTAPERSNFDAEEIYSYELGYRLQATPTLSFDTTVYYTDYNKMRGVSPLNIIPTQTHIIQPLALDNANTAIGRGIELSTKWQARDDLRFTLDYAYVNNSIPVADGLEPDSTPRQKVSLRTMYDIKSNVNLDVWLRYQSETNVGGFVNSSIVPSVNVPSFVNMDVRLAWQPTKSLALSLVGKNLLYSQRLEGANPSWNSQVVEIQRSVLAVAEWKF